MKTAEPITIIGAGLAGVFMAILLAKQGYTVDIYERFTEEQLTEEYSKRSFNLTFYFRGTEAFKKAGLLDAVQPILRVLEGSSAHSKHGEVYTPFDTKEKPQYVVERPVLLQILIREAKKFKNIHFHFDTSLVSVERTKKTITIQNNKTQKKQTLHPHVVFGADGVNSLVRTYLQEGQVTKHLQEYLPWTYKQVKIPLQIANQLQWKPKTEHFFHTHDALLVAFPNADASFTGMLLLPKNKEPNFTTLTSEQTITKFLHEKFPGMQPAYPLFIQSLLEHPEGRLVTIDTIPWYFEDFLVIIGDAAHGVLPFYGQGMSAAFEDCLTIVTLMERHGTDWKTIFSEYQTTRKKNTDVLADLSKESFERLEKYKQVAMSAINNRLDLILHKLFPKFWLPPIYNLIADDPDEFHKIMEKHNKRRKMATLFGISVIAGVIYGALTVKRRLFNNE